MSNKDENKDKLDALAQRFLDSAKSLRNVAQRMAEAADSSSLCDEQDRMIQSDVKRAVKEVASSHFTYLEFLEFNSAEEFRHFRSLGPVSREEINSTDIDELCRDLLAS